MQISACACLSYANVNLRVCANVVSANICVFVRISVCLRVKLAQVSRR